MKKILPFTAIFLQVLLLSHSSFATTETGYKDETGLEHRVHEITSADHPIVDIYEYSFRPEDKFLRSRAEGEFAAEYEDYLNYQSSLKNSAAIHKTLIRVEYDSVPMDFSSIDQKSCDRYYRIARDPKTDFMDFSINEDKEPCLANRTAAAQKWNKRTVTGFECEASCDQKIKDIQAQLAQGKALKLDFSYFYQDHFEDYIPEHYNVGEPK